MRRAPRPQQPAVGNYDTCPGWSHNCAARSDVDRLEAAMESTLAPDDDAALSAQPLAVMDEGPAYWPGGSG